MTNGGFVLFIRTLTDWLRERRRKIFHYHDGVKYRRIDPLIVGTRLEEKCPDYTKHLETIMKDPTKLPPGPLLEELVRSQREAGAALAQAAREIFDIKPLSDTGGLTEGESLRVLTKFLVFMERLASEAKVFQTSPEAA